MRLRYDLHLHSCLSPCGSDDMTPNNLVNMAALLGYDLIAVTDHNACGNAAAVLQAAGRPGCWPPRAWSCAPRRRPTWCACSPPWRPRWSSSPWCAAAACR